MAPESFSNVVPFARPVPPALASRPRTSLWDLPDGCLCPVIGSCLSVDDLRRLLNALFGGHSSAGEFELHAGVVRECATRNKVSLAIQQELDDRHDDAIRSLADCSGSALAAAWSSALASGGVAGTLWALLTHPAADDELRERLMRDLHMAQHHTLACSAVLQAANEQLRRDNERLRERLARHDSADARRADAGSLS